MEGLEADEGFNVAIEYGNAWHDCEEAAARGKDWERVLRKRYDIWRNHYPASEDETRKWFYVCKTTFPLYLEHWSKTAMEKGRIPILSEETFSIPYPLPSGRVVTLRGKYDAVFANLGKKPAYILQENKSKATIDEEGLLKTLHENLQTMFYLISLRHAGALAPQVSDSDTSPKGFQVTPTKLVKLPEKKGVKPWETKILYNVARRPLSDIYSIRQRKDETEKEFYERLGQNIKERPEHYFFRWEIEITDAEIEMFKNKVLDPILEQLMDWWEWIVVDPFDPWRPRTYGELKWHEFPDDDFVRNTFHWQSPWGVYNSLAMGFRGSYFEYLTSGSKIGLRQSNTLYPELSIP